MSVLTESIGLEDGQVWIDSNGDTQVINFVELLPIVNIAVFASTVSGLLLDGKGQNIMSNGRLSPLSLVKLKQ